MKLKISKSLLYFLGVTIFYALLCFIPSEKTVIEGEIMTITGQLMPFSTFALPLSALFSYLSFIVFWSDNPGLMRKTL